MFRKMAGFHNVAALFVILVCSSAASLSQEVLLPVPQHSDRPKISGYSGFFIEIQVLPWHASVQCGERVCSGVILHQDWVLVPQTCRFNDGNGSDIRVFAGANTPENATQVLNAEIHQTTDPLKGVTLLHLQDSLALGKKVQPARIPCVALGNFNYLYGFASGFAHEGNTVQLKAFDTTLFTDLCPDSEGLCALGLDWPHSEVYARVTRNPVQLFRSVNFQLVTNAFDSFQLQLAGIDFLGLPDYYDGGDADYNCLIGRRKAQLGNDFTSYYPLLNIVPSIERELGLVVKPTPPTAYPDKQTLCGILQ